MEIIRGRERELSRPFLLPAFAAVSPWPPPRAPRNHNSKVRLTAHTLTDRTRAWSASLLRADPRAAESLEPPHATQRSACCWSSVRSSLAAAICFCVCLPTSILQSRQRRCIGCSGRAGVAWLGLACCVWLVFSCATDHATRVRTETANQRETRTGEGGKRVVGLTPALAFCLWWIALCSLVPESRSGRSRSPAAAPREEESKTEGGSAAAAAEGAAAAASSSAEGSSSKADRKRDGSSSKNSPSKHSPAKDHHRSSRHKHSDRRSRSRDRDRRSSRDRSSRDRRSRSRSRSLDRHRSSRRHHRDSRSRSRSRSRRSRSRSSRSRARRSSRSRSYESRSRSRSRDRRSKYDPTSIRSALGTVEPNSLIQSQMATQNPQITRVARRLYVGNLPAASGLTEGMISDLFRTTVVALGIATPNPILSVWLSAEQTFCFVEFRAVQDCSLALTLLQGIQIMGRTLRVGRPADYKPLPPHLANYVVGNPMGVGAPPPTFATNIPFMTALTQGRSPLTDPIVMVSTHIDRMRVERQGANSAVLRAVL